MRITDPLQGVGDVMEAYDEIYLESWNQTLIECENSLELDDYDRALQVKSLYHFRQELDTLMTEYCDEASTKAIKLIYPTLDHYETFAQNFVSMMAHPVETSMLWGLLYLVFKLALAGSREPAEGSIGAIGPLRPLTRITRWLERIGHKLRASNDCKLTIADYNKIKGDTIEMNKEIIILWLNIIMTF